MTRNYHYNGHDYWVTIEPVIHETNRQTYFIAYVSDTEPDAFLYGASVKGPDGKIILFETELSALTNANMIKQSELDINR